MFVVATVLNELDRTAKEDTFVKVYPVVFENAEEGHVHPPITKAPSREDAQKLADALNKVLADNTKGSTK